MNYDLVFEGGGAKGMAFVGAMQEFEDRGHTYERLLGTSAGAISATLLAAGYTSGEMLGALEEKKDGKSVFVSFMGEPDGFTEEEIHASSTRDFLRNIDLTAVPNFAEERLDNELAMMMMSSSKFRNVFSLVERGGWYSARSFIDWIQEKLDSGRFRGRPRNFSAMTFSEFFAATNVDLSLVAADVSADSMLVLNHKTAPDCPVVWATRMSMSIPLVWEEVIWQKDWGKYRGRSMEGHAIVDGGLLSNFPIELLISDRPSVTAVMGDKRSRNVLGLLIDEKMAIEGLAESVGPELVDAQDVNVGELATLKRLKRLLDTATSAHDKMVLETAEGLVVRIPAKGFGVTEFDMSEERRKALIESGRKAMQKYLEKPLPEGAALSFDPNSAEGIATSAAADHVAERMLGE